MLSTLHAMRIKIGMSQCAYWIAACRAFRNYDMQPRGPYDSRIEIREGALLRPLVKSLLLVVSISTVVRGGYLIGHSSVIRHAALGHEFNYAVQRAVTAPGLEASLSDRPIDTLLSPQPESYSIRKPPTYEYARASPQIESLAQRVVYVPAPQGKVLAHPLTIAPCSNTPPSSS